MWLLQAKRAIQKLIFGIMDKKEMNAKVTYLSLYMKQVMKKLEEDKKRPAMHTYTSTLNSFIKFAESSTETEEIIEAEMEATANRITTINKDAGTAKGETADISVSKVFTPSKLKEYETWLRNKNAKWNTVSTYMRTLKAVYNRLVREELLKYDAKLFDDVYTKVESQTKRALTEEQMNTLLHTDFSKLPEKLQCALAYFLLMFFFRGMPFIDLAYLRKQDVKGSSIIYCRHKTGRKIIVRIPKEAVGLFEQYQNKGTDSGYLFPILDNAVKKEKETYVLYQKALRDFNYMLEKLAVLLLPGMDISSYTARHTWATLAFYAGIPIGIISKALGHSSIKVTETYLKPFENEKVDEANDALIMSVIKGNEDKRIA